MIIPFNMKTIKIKLTEREYLDLCFLKRDRTWEEFILALSDYYKKQYSMFKEV